MALLRPREQSTVRRSRNQPVPARGCGVKGFWEMLGLEAAAVLGPATRQQGGAAACPTWLTQEKQSMELCLQKLPGAVHPAEG